MTTIAAEPVVTTATARHVLRRSLFWVGAVVIGLLVTLASVLVLGGTNVADEMSANDPSPVGAKALARVLEKQGVRVTETESLDATADAVAGPANTTILVYDANQYLETDQLDRLGRLADRIVLVAPTFTALQALAPSVDLAGRVSGTLTADCSLPAATRAGSVRGDGSGYRVGDAAASTIACFGSGDGTYSVVRLTGDARQTVTVVGTTEAFENGHIAEDGDAALALNLLGETEHLVWYRPGVADLPDHGGPTIAELTPGWVTPVTILAILTAIAAALWRGRRMGALVVENLPVTVKASETMEGRARLYAAGSARLHALDALRIGTIERLSTLCGLPRAATVDEVIDAVAAVVAIDPAPVRALLLARTPTTDAELVRLSDDLLELERRVASALRLPTVVDDGTARRTGEG